MNRRSSWPLFATVLLCWGCSRKAGGPSLKPEAQKSSASHSASDADDATAIVSESANCRALIERWVKTRAALNVCDSSNDCADIGAPICPQESAYVSSTADLAPLGALSRKIEESCELPECEPPRALGPATCRVGSCEEGRSPPGPECWDYRATYLEQDELASGAVVTGVRGITPRFVFGAGKAGTLTVEARFTDDCPRCEILVSEKNSQFSAEVSEALAPTTREARALKRSLPATPGLYYIVVKGENAGVDVLLRAALAPTDGSQHVVTHHGIAWLRLCEG